MAVAVVPAAAADRFVDLARLGRTDAWSGAAGWREHRRLVPPRGGGVLHGRPRRAPAAGRPGRRRRGAARRCAAGFGLGVRSAVTFCQGRPFGSLFGPDLRLRPGRVAAGAGLWLAGLAAGIAVAAAIDTLSGGPAAAGRAVATGAPPWGQSALLLAAGAVAFPLQSGAEELVFRGWLTQTLGQLVRPRLQLAALVGILFAAAHVTARRAGLPGAGRDLGGLFPAQPLRRPARARDRRPRRAQPGARRRGIVVDRSDHLFTHHHAVGWYAVVFAVVQGTVAVLLARLILRPADAPGALPEAPPDRNRPPAAPLRGIKGWRIGAMARQGGGDQGPKDGGMRVPHRRAGRRRGRGGRRRPDRDRGRRGRRAGQVRWRRPRTRTWMPWRAAPPARPPGPAAPWAVAPVEAFPAAHLPVTATAPRTAPAGPNVAADLEDVKGATGPGAKRSGS